MDANLFLRLAEPSDCKLLFDWANDEVTRANAFSTEPIEWEEHKAWFAGMMANPSEIQYILMQGSEPVGQIRLSICEKAAEAEISYSIAGKYRGSGYGKAIVSLVMQEASKSFPKVKRLVARVKPSNEASLHCFYKNGFDKKYICLEYEL